MVQALLQSWMNLWQSFDQQRSQARVEATLFT